MSASGIAVFMFHSVGQDRDHLTVAGPRLLSFLECLVTSGKRVVGMTEALRAADTNTVGLTFDDAMADFLTNAAPVLEELGCRATVYAPVAHLGGSADWLAGPLTGRRLMGWSGLGEVLAAGHEVGSHGYRHAPLDVLNASQVHSEVARAKGEIEDHLQVPVPSFAYPHGYASRRTARIVAAVGHRNACVIGRRHHRVGGDPMRVTRLEFVSDRDPGSAPLMVDQPKVSASVVGRELAQPAWRVARTAMHHLGIDVS